jgi:hypothetical protein
MVVDGHSESWYLLTINGDYSIATWYDDPDTYRSIQFRCVKPAHPKAPVPLPDKQP